MMLLRSITVLALAMAPGLAQAEYIVPPFAERIENSDLIVVGTLHNVSSETREGYDFETGVIEVVFVLQGKASPGDNLRIQWKNEEHIICPRTGHPNAEDTLALWLLERAHKGLYLGRYPEYTIVLSQNNDVLALYEQELSEAAAAESLPPKARRVWDFLKQEQWKELELGEQQSNNWLNLPGQPVTVRACARPAPGRPAG